MYPTSKHSKETLVPPASLVNHKTYVSPTTHKKPVSDQVKNSSERYLLRLPPQEFTVQIIGLHDVNKLQRFIKENHLGNNAHYFRTTMQGKPWYILVYGHFKSKTAAMNAIQALPKKSKARKTLAPRPG